MASTHHNTLASLSRGKEGAPAKARAKPRLPAALPSAHDKPAAKVPKRTDGGAKKNASRRLQRQFGQVARRTSRELRVGPGGGRPGRAYGLPARRGRGCR